MANVNIPPPPKPLSIENIRNEINSIMDYIKNDLFNYFNALYQFLYFIWLRTGGYNSSIPTYSPNVTRITNTGNTDSNLLQYTLAANSLTSDGHYIIAEGFGTFAANTNNKRIRLYFGSVVLYDTTSLALNSGTWNIKAQIYRASSSSQKVVVTVLSSNSLIASKIAYYTIGQNLTTDIVIKFIATGVVTGDIIQEGLIIQFN